MQASLRAWSAEQFQYHQQVSEEGGPAGSIPAQSRRADEVWAGTTSSFRSELCWVTTILSFPGLGNLKNPRVSPSLHSCIQPMPRRPFFEHLHLPNDTRDGLQTIKDQIDLSLIQLIMLSCGRGKLEAHKPVHIKVLEFVSVCTGRYRQVSVCTVVCIQQYMQILCNTYLFCT